MRCISLRTTCANPLDLNQFAQRRTSVGRALAREVVAEDANLGDMVMLVLVGLVDQQIIDRELHHQTTPRQAPFPKRTARRHRAENRA